MSSDSREFSRRIQLAMRQLIASAILTNEAIAKRVGLRLPDMQTLGIIALASEPMTPRDVSAATDMPSSSTTRALDRLEQAGYLRRLADPSDRRKVSLEVNREKISALSTQYAEVTARMDAHNARFTSTELEIVTRYLEGLPLDLPAGR